MPKQFYTYVHYRPDETPFYVGKGYGGRCTSRADRNIKWHEVVITESWENIRIEVIPRISEQDALSYEKELIALYRSQGFLLVNRTSGGQGTSGMRHTEETKRKLSVAHTGKKLSEEHKAAVSKAGKARKIKYWPPKTPEAKARAGASRKGYKFTEQERIEHSLRMQNRKPISDQGRINISISLKGKKHSPERTAMTAKSISAHYELKRKLGISLAKSDEHKAKIAAALKGHKLSEETKKKLSNSHKGKKHRPETIEKLKARKHTPEEIQKQISAQSGKKQSPEHTAKIKKALVAHFENKRQVLSNKDSQ